MSQVSRPFQIALVAALVMLAVWFVALRHKGGESTPAPAPAASASAPAQAPAATAPAKTKPAPAAPAHTAAPKAPPTDPADRALAHGKTVVLLVWNGHSADDVAARAAVAGVDRHGGKVVPIVTTPAHVARYADITRGAHVGETPTIVVVSPKRQAQRITGFTDTAEVDQVVADVLGS